MKENPRFCVVDDCDSPQDRPSWYCAEHQQYRGNSKIAYCQPTMLDEELDRWRRRSSTDKTTA